MKRRVQHLETIGSSYASLEAVGRALELDCGRGLRTTFKLDSTICTAELDITSGTVVGVQFGAKFEGPQNSLTGPSMKLRREVFSDIEDKGNFVSLEVQVGDEDFDMEIYVDSTAVEPEVKRFLSRPEARAAARWLIDHEISSIEIDREGVRAVTKRRPEDLEKNIAEIYESVIMLARGGALRGTEVKPRAAWLAPVGGLAAFSGFALFIFTIPVEASTASGWIGAIAGIGIAISSAPLLRGPIQRATSGHSSSGNTARVATATFCIALGFATALLIRLAVNLAVG